MQEPSEKLVDEVVDAVAEADETPAVDAATPAVAEALPEPACPNCGGKQFTVTPAGHLHCRQCGLMNHPEDTVGARRAVLKEIYHAPKDAAG